MAWPNVRRHDLSLRTEHFRLNAIGRMADGVLDGVIELNAAIVDEEGSRPSQRDKGVECGYAA